MRNLEYNCHRSEDIMKTLINVQKNFHNVCKKVEMKVEEQRNHIDKRQMIRSISNFRQWKNKKYVEKDIDDWIKYT